MYLENTMPPRSVVIVVISLLALLHYYIGARLLPDMPVTMVFKAFGVALLVLSLLLIPAGLLYRLVRHRALGDRLAWAGMFAMGVFSSMLVLTFVRVSACGSVWPLAGRMIATWGNLR